MIVILSDWVAAARARLRPPPWASRRAFDAIEFVIVDVETTGWSPEEAGITEIGAVRMSGGQIRAEFSTLVNPGRAIPPDIVALTGITDEMVTAAPAAGRGAGQLPGLRPGRGAHRAQRAIRRQLPGRGRCQRRPARARRASAGHSC